MLNKLTFYLIIAGLLGIGIWGITLISDKPAASHAGIEQKPDSRQHSRPPETIKTTSPGVIKNTAELADSDNLEKQLNQVRQLLKNHQAEQAASFINSRYSSLSTEDLAKFKALFYQQKAYFGDAEPGLVKKLFSAASQVFDEVDVWDVLAQTAIELEDWRAAFEALMRGSAIESNPTRLEQKLQALVISSSHLRTSLEQRSDKIGIKELFQRAYELHPNHPRFQLELGFAHLNLDNLDTAETFINPLQYDPDLGAIARHALNKINKQRANNQNAVAGTGSDSQNNARGNASDIVVPLIRAGTSLLVDSSINGRRTRLLLDTGASITALSTSLIQRLNLPPTGQAIQLNTANGVRRARLFRAKNVRLGPTLINDAVVAEIDLGGSSNFQGLLGTDLLNRSNRNYSYLIDNQRNALIFRRR